MPYTCTSVHHLRCSRLPVACRAALPAVRPDRGRRVIMEAVGQPPDPSKDPNRPHCHVMARRGWINDPNGPIFFGGKYHMCVPANSIPNPASFLLCWQRCNILRMRVCGLCYPRGSLVSAARYKLLRQFLPGQARILLSEILPLFLLFPNLHRRAK